MSRSDDTTSLRRIRRRARPWWLARPGWTLLRGGGTLRFDLTGAPSLRPGPDRWQTVPTIREARHQRDRRRAPQTPPDLATERMLAAGNRTPAGWFFSPLPLPVDQLPTAPDSLFVVHIPFGRSGFRVGGRPVSVRMLAQTIRCCPDWGHRPVVLVAEGATVDGDALGSLLAGLAAALKVTVTSSPGPILLGPRILLAQAGFFSRAPGRPDPVDLGRTLPALHHLSMDAEPVFTETQSVAANLDALAPGPSVPQTLSAQSFRMPVSDLQLPDLTGFGLPPTHPAPRPAEPAFGPADSFEDMIALVTALAENHEEKDTTSETLSAGTIPVDEDPVWVSLLENEIDDAEGPAAQSASEPLSDSPESAAQPMPEELVPTASGQTDAVAAASVVEEPTNQDEADALTFAAELAELLGLSEPVGLADRAEPAGAVGPTEVAESGDLTNRAEAAGPGELADRVELAEPVEPSEVTGPVEVAGQVELAGAVEPSEVAAAAAEPVELTDRAGAAGPVGLAGQVEQAEAVEPSEVTAGAAELADRAELTGPVRLAGPVELAEVAGPVEPSEANAATAKSVGLADQAELAEVTGLADRAEQVGMARSVESTGMVGATGPVEPTDQAELAEVAGAAGSAELTDRAESIEVAGAVGPVGRAERAEAAGAVEPTEVARAAEPVDPTDRAGAVEPTDVAGAAEPIGLAGRAEAAAEPAETAEAAEPVDLTDRAESIEVAGAAGPVGRAELAGAVEPTEVASAGDPVESTEVAGAAGPIGLTERAEALGALKPAETAGVAEPVELTGRPESIEVAGAARPVGRAELAEAVESTEGAGVAGPAEPTNRAEAAESVKLAESAELTGADNPAEAAEPTHPAMEPESLGAKAQATEPAALASQVVAPEPGDASEPAALAQSPELVETAERTGAVTQAEAADRADAAELAGPTKVAESAEPTVPAAMAVAAEQDEAPARADDEQAEPVAPAGPAAAAEFVTPAEAADRVDRAEQAESGALAEGSGLADAAGSAGTTASVESVESIILERDEAAVRAETAERTEPDAPAGSAEATRIVEPVDTKEITTPAAVAESSGATGPAGSAEMAEMNELVDRATVVGSVRGDAGDHADVVTAADPADLGEHDENVSPAVAANKSGGPAERAESVLRTGNTEPDDASDSSAWFKFAGRFRRPGRVEDSDQSREQTEPLTDVTETEPAESMGESGAGQFALADLEALRSLQQHTEGGGERSERPQEAGSASGERSEPLQVSASFEVPASVAPSAGSTMPEGPFSSTDMAGLHHRSVSDESAKGHASEEDSASVEPQVSAGAAEVGRASKPRGFAEEVKGASDELPMAGEAPRSAAPVEPSESAGVSGSTGSLASAKSSAADEVPEPADVSEEVSASAERSTSAEPLAPMMTSAEPAETATASSISTPLGTLTSGAIPTAQPVGAVMEMLWLLVDPEVPTVVEAAVLPAEPERALVETVTAVEPVEAADESSEAREVEAGSEQTIQLAPARGDAGKKRVPWVEVAGPATPTDREQVKALLGWRYEAQARAVTGVLALQPGLRAVGGDDLIVGLIAVRAHLAGAGAVVDAVLRGEKIQAEGGFAEIDPVGAELLGRCARAGLSRLPAVVGPVFRAGSADTSQLEQYRSGVRLVEPAFTEARLDPWVPPESTVEYAIWSSTARNTDRMAGHGEELGARVLFSPGTQFVVLDVEQPEGGGPLRVLLRELPPSAVRKATDEAVDERTRERLRDSIRTSRPVTPADQNVPAQWRYPIGIHSDGSLFALASRLPEGTRS